MSGTFAYPFEELPLLVEGGIEAGLVSGEAEIAYYDDAEWFVRGIALDGFLRVPGASRFEDKRIEIDNPKSEIFLAIQDRLTSGKFADSITEKVHEDLAQDGISVRGNRAEHSTYHSAYSGV